MINFGRIKKLFGLGKEPAKETGAEAAREAVEETENTCPDELTEAIQAAQEECRLNLNEELRAKYADLLENSEIRENYILYEAFGGRGMTCSPYAVFKYLLTQPDFAEFVHVWVIDDFSDNAWQMELYKNHKNVRFVKHQSPEYREALATCKYLINNVSFPGYFTKRKGQIYVDTWHGIPLKTIGFDIPTGNVSAGNSARNLLAADYLLSPNGFMTEIYKKAFKMEGLFEGTILEEGQPRNDNYFHTGREEILKKLSASGVNADPEKKIILYAPTWKGSKYSSPDTGLDAYFEMIRTVEENVDTSKYQVFVKPHQIVYYYIKNTQGITGQFIPATIDTNELLSVVDVLISDYSSIYFDFLVSGKPILFFIPDLDEYLGYRGLYYGIDKLPGPIARSFPELAVMLRDVEQAMEPCREKYKQEAAWACPRDDGEVCRRVTDVIFRGRKSENGIRCNAADRKKLLVYAGDFANREITHSFMTLAQLLDDRKFDVTVLAEGSDEEAQMRIRSLPRALRVLYRGQPFNGTPEEKAKYRLAVKNSTGTEELKGFFERECRRLFGESGFDYAMDFTGSSELFSRLFPYLKNTKTVSFQGKFIDLPRMEKELKSQSELSLAQGSFCVAEVQEDNFTAPRLTVVPMPQKEKVNYVSMGSLTKENDFEGLLKGFAEYSRERKDACLYLLGDGPERKRLEQVITEEGLKPAVRLLGELQRPFAFLKGCSAYVQSPGQTEDSMAVLEAEALGLHVVRADFVTEIKSGFDPAEYNRKAYGEFERLFHE